MSATPKSDNLVSMIQALQFCSYADDHIAMVEAIAAGIRNLEKGAAHWEKMYTAAQNANAYRQDALESLL